MKNQHFLDINSLLFQNLNLKVIWQVSSEEPIRDLYFPKKVTITYLLYFPKLLLDKICLEKPKLNWDFTIGYHVGKKFQIQIIEIKKQVW